VILCSILYYIFFDLYFFFLKFTDISSTWCSSLCYFHGIQSHYESPHFFFHFCIRSTPSGWHDSTASPTNINQILDTTNDINLPPFSFICCLKTNSISDLIPLEATPVPQQGLSTSPSLDRSNSLSLSSSSVPTGTSTK
jgi:hypothetical protein